MVRNKIYLPLHQKNSTDMYFLFGLNFTQILNISLTLYYFKSLWGQYNHIVSKILEKNIYNATI